MKKVIYIHTFHFKTYVSAFFVFTAVFNLSLFQEKHYYLFHYFYVAEYKSTVAALNNIKRFIDNNNEIGQN